MARAKKSSLDSNEPVVVQGEEMIHEEPITEQVVEKAEEQTAERKKEKKETEAQNKTVGGTKRRGVKICVF